jgi:hypothetical protein
MGRLLVPAWISSLAAAALLAAAGSARALNNDFDLSLDLRAVATSDLSSYLYGGGGKLRFDDDHDGLRLGSLRLGYRGDLTDTLRLSAEAFAYDDGNGHAIDLTEFYLSWRPVPASLWRSEIKLGAFYPAISLEHRMRGWRTPYSLTPSAINTWIGEEIRTVGAEYDLDWLKQQDGSAWNVGLNVAAFGWNDPAGTIIASRGWALHDRQTTLFSEIGKTDSPLVYERRLIYDDIDGRAGYYVGATANYRGLLELRALHYDNRADPAKEAPAIEDGAWLTQFESLGARWTPDDHWTLMAQSLHGITDIGTAPVNHWWYESSYALVSWKQGRHRLTARYDDFSMAQTVSNFGAYNADGGHALLGAYLYELNSHVTFIGEALQIKSRLEWRPWVGEPMRETEREYQLAVRYEL